LEQDHYFLRGVSLVATESSLLVSSSRYLNHGRLRDWIAMVCLRRNGADFPAPAELVELLEILEELRDRKKLEQLFREERRVNPQLDAWFDEEYYAPPMTVEDYARYPAGSPGGILYSQFVNKYEVQFVRDQWDKADSQFDYYTRRQIQTHDLEHILTGGTVDALGELVPSWFRMTNVPKFLVDQELACELVIIHILSSLRYTVRTMLHYPWAWMSCADAIHRGLAVGRASEGLFMQKLEPVLGLPLAEARAALGVRGVVDRDTTEVSAYWNGGVAPPPLLSAREMAGLPG
jgi:ubiquinone biosynthesis protein COQ4